MNERKNKNLTLLACTIENGKISKNHSDLFVKLKTKLEDNTLTVKARCMPLNATAPDFDFNKTDFDLLSDFINNDSYIFGVMFRIAPAKESPSIPENLFTNNTIKINDIQNQEQNSNLICKDHYYFLLNKSLLISNLSKSKIKSFQVYLNWILNGTDFKITPKIKSQDEIKFGEIESIIFEDPKTTKVSGASIKHFSLSKMLDMFSDAPSIENLLNERLISAKLKLKLTKQPKDMSQNDYEKVLGCIMKPISDEDGIAFKLKNGKRISGSNITCTKPVSVEKIDDFRINEPELLQEMISFLNEL